MGANFTNSYCLSRYAKKCDNLLGTPSQLDLKSITFVIITLPKNRISDLI